MPLASAAGPQTLTELLGLEVDYLTGKCYVGRLSAADVAFLHGSSPSNPFNNRPGQSNSSDAVYNPTPPKDRSDFFYDFNDVDERDCDDMIPPSLRGLIPSMADHEQFRFTYLKCDFIPLHDDVGMNRFDLLHAMVIVFAAPHGCNLVTNEEFETTCAPGDVFLINDQVRHGAYPLSRTESTSVEDLAGISDRNKKSFVDRNCLSFLLITGRV